MSPWTQIVYNAEIREASFARSHLGSAMICISIAQESRHMALADMINAVALGADLIEIRLDAFEHAPNFSDMLSAKRAPVLFSCYQ